MSAEGGKLARVEQTSHEGEYVLRVGEDVIGNSHQVDPGALTERADKINAAHSSRVKGLVDAVEAYQELSTCYRIGKRPSEALFGRLEKAKKLLESYRAGEKGE